jgi:hypothetical protein
MARHGTAGMAGRGWSWRGRAFHGRRGAARPGKAWHFTAGEAHGGARHFTAGPQELQHLLGDMLGHMRGDMLGHRAIERQQRQGEAELFGSI